MNGSNAMLYLPLNRTYPKFRSRVIEDWPSCRPVVISSIVSAFKSAWNVIRDPRLSSRSSYRRHDCIVGSSLSVSSKEVQLQDQPPESRSTTYRHPLKEAIVSTAKLLRGEARLGHVVFQSTTVEDELPVFDSYHRATLFATESSAKFVSSCVWNLAQLKRWLRGSDSAVLDWQRYSAKKKSNAS